MFFVTQCRLSSFRLNNLLDFLLLTTFAGLFSFRHSFFSILLSCSVNLYNLLLMVMSIWEIEALLSKLLCGGTTLFSSVVPLVDRCYSHVLVKDRGFLKRKFRIKTCICNCLMFEILKRLINGLKALLRYLKFKLSVTSTES